MKVYCPRCHAELEIADEEHYKDVVCPHCDNSFQAVSAATEQVGREFLDQILRETKTKPESAGPLSRSAREPDLFLKRARRQ